jgi:hypothetical protein
VRSDSDESGVPVAGRRDEAGEVGKGVEPSPESSGLRLPDAPDASLLRSLWVGVLRRLLGVNETMNSL